MRLNIRSLFIVLLIFPILLTGCSSMTIDQYSDREPQMRPEEYFDGHVKAWGIFEGRSGAVEREFTADFKGEWDGEVLTLDETLRYTDGDTESRVWKISKTGDGTYELNGEDIVGTGTGEAAGNAYHMEYTMGVDVSGSTWNLSFDDWMYRQDETTVINRVDISYWGFHAGELTIVYRKVE